MVRGPRIDLPNYVYHVYARGQRGQPLFFSYHDMDVFEDIVYRALQKFDFDILTYSLMKTHYHFGMFRKMIGLSRIFHWINTMYAMYLNKTYRLIGHVFQNRFNSRIVLNERYYYIFAEYIHKNAHKAGYVKEGQIYKYSSEGFYLNNEPNRLVTMPIANNYPDLKIDKSIFESPFYIGLDEDFNNKNLINIKNMFFKKDNKNKLFKEVLKIILDHYNINYNYFVSKSKNKKLVSIRRNIINCLYYKYGFSTIKIGKEIGMSYQNVAKIVNKLVEKSEGRP
jgi:hypothetical protein